MEQKHNGVAPVCRRGRGRGGEVRRKGVGRFYIFITRVFKIDTYLCRYMDGCMEHIHDGVAPVCRRGRGRDGEVRRRGVGRERDPEVSDPYGQLLPEEKKTDNYNISGEVRWRND